MENEEDAAGNEHPLGLPEVNKKKYERFKYTEEDMSNALESIRSKNMSLNKASVHYNIPKSTLSNKLNGKTIEDRRMGPPSVLTTLEEKYLEEWIIGKAKIGFPMHKDDVKDAVCKVMKDTGRKNPFTDDRPGEKWVSLFLKRHPLITQRNTETINKGKACITEDDIKEYFKGLENYLKEENCEDILMDGDRIYNADETGVECCPKTGKVLGPKNYKDFYSIAPGKEKESITVLANFSASGLKVPPMIVLPYKRIPRDVAESVPPDYFIGRSDSGWMVSATFYEYIANCFYPWLLENAVKFPVLLLLDGHKSHINLELSKFCSEKQIIVYALLPNATNILQPCDVGVFRPLKAAWKTSVRKWKLKHGNAKTLSKVNFTPVFQEALEASVNIDKIKSAFRKSGLFPFNVENVDFNKCMQKRHKEIRKIKPQSSEEKSFFKVLESEIPQEVLETFRIALEDASTVVEEALLFSIWRKHRDNQEDTDPNDTEVNGNQNNNLTASSDILEFDPETGIENSNVDLPPSSQNGPTNEAENLKENNTEEPLIVESSEEALITPNRPKLLVLTTLGQNQLQPVASTSALIPEPLTTPEDILRKHLSWPEISREEGTRTKKCTKRKIPFAMTSKKWQDMHQAERIEKENKEHLKKQKREEREAKKKKKDEMRNIKKGKSTKKKVRRPNEEVETSTEEDCSMSLHDSDESINNLDDLKMYTELQKSDTESEKENEERGINLDDIKINQTYVIVDYEQEFFPGIITQRKGSRFEVSTLNMCGGASGLSWKWPDPEDKIWYYKNNIKEIIQPPKLISITSSRSSGVYSVPEMEKFRKSSG